MTQSSVKIVWVEGFVNISLTMSKLSTQIVSPGKSDVKYTDKLIDKTYYQCKTLHHIHHSNEKSIE